MKKKVCALALGCCMAIGLTLPLAVCFNLNKGFSQNVELTKNGVSIKFDKVVDAESYNVYHSPSRFGDYKLVGSQTSLKFKSDDSYGYFRVDAMKDDRVIHTKTYSYENELFGDNVYVYSPKDNQQKVEEEINYFTDNITGQFSTERFAALFKTGKYNDLDLRMSYYMTFNGLGYLPTDTEIGKYNVYAELSGGNATCNFWRGIENFTVNSDVQWAVSQATSFRRMVINGNVALTQKGGDSPWGSGGFISDSKITGTVDAGAQQQWLMRNSTWGNWMNADINMVYVGCEGEFADNSYVWPTRRITNLETTKVMAEKPYLVFDDKGYAVMVPEVKHGSSGLSWKDGNNDTRVGIDKFYVAQSDRDNAKTINAALKKGKHILFTPGIYSIESPLLVTKPDTIITGLGLATLKLANGNDDTIMKISDVDGVRVSSVIFDAGTSSSTLMQVGTKKTNVSHKSNPVVINDVYYRIGGAENAPTQVDCTLEINSNDVVGDNFWIWRADHSYGVGWETGLDDSGNVLWAGNVTTNGIIVNGDDVTIYGLMVEHFHEYQTIWKGENGYMAFYQSETPYDVPEQSAWQSRWNGVTYDGYASYKVDDDVQNHTAYGVGVYFVSRGSVFVLDHGIELPSNSEINVQHMAIANFSSPENSGIRYIVNEYGKDVISPLKNGQKTQWTSFIAGESIS